MKLKKPKRTIFAIAVVAILIVSSVTVYASGIWKNFHFSDDSYLYSVTTKEVLTEKEAIALNNTADATCSQVETFRFFSIAEASKTLDMQIPIPSYLNNFSMADITGDKTKTNNRAVMIGFKKNNSRDLVISIQRSNLNNIVSQIIQVEKPLETEIYTVPSGAEFIIHKYIHEYPKEIFYVASIQIDDYYYTVSFYNNQSIDEIKLILNSIDISSLQQQSNFK